MTEMEPGRQKQTSRTRLLDAARSLFYEKGYNATTLAEISKVSGVNNGLITYYFGSKNRLAQQIYSQYLMKVRNDISELLFPEKTEYSMALGIAVENRILMGHKFDNPNVLRFYNEYQADFVPFSEPNSVREEYYDLQRELINPQISDIDLKLYSICGVHIIQSISAAYEQTYLDYDPDYLKDYVIRMLFHMLQLPPQRIEELVTESRYWEHRLNIRVGQDFQVYADQTDSAPLD